MPLQVLRIEARRHGPAQAMTLWRRVFDDVSPGMGDFLRAPSQTWVARVSLDGNRLVRNVLSPRVDYENSNSKGTRGVYYIYFLEPGFYDVCDSWRRPQWSPSRRHPGRYFIEVTDHGIEEDLTEYELRCRLKKSSSESTS